MSLIKETQLDTTESVVDTPAVEVEEPLPPAPENKPKKQLPPVPNPTPANAINDTTENKVEVTLDIESKAIVETFVDAIEGDFDLNSVMELVPKLMKHVQSYKKFTGPQKKKLVIKMINHIIDITDTPYVDDATWDPIMKQLVPKLIDTLVEVNNGKLVLKKRKCMWLRLFLPSCCCSKPSATVE